MPRYAKDYSNEANNRHNDNAWRDARSHYDDRGERSTRKQFDAQRTDRTRQQSDARSAQDAELRRQANNASALIGARNAARNTSAGSSATNVNARAAERRGAARKTRQRDSANAVNKRVSRPHDANRTAGARTAGTHAAVQAKPTLLSFIVQNAVYIVGVAAVAAIVAILLMTVKSCVPTPTYDFDGELDFNYESPYNWDNLENESGHLAYVDGGESRSRTGIDVSENQGEIDWQAVAADGIEFAMVRLGYRGATEGDLFTDALFAQNLAGAQAAGIDCGVYFFSQATNAKEAKAEADFVIEQLGGAKLAYPVAYDFEQVVAGVDTPRAANLGKDQMTKIAEAFCSRIEKAGYRSMIYGNYYDLNLYHYESLTDDDIWWAEYDVAEPSPHLDIVMWQYSNGGWVDGISTVVDMNIDLSGALAS